MAKKGHEAKWVCNLPSHFANFWKALWLLGPSVPSALFCFHILSIKKKLALGEIVLNWIIIYFYLCQLSFCWVMIDAELMIIFHIYQCGIHVPDVTIKEVVTKSMLCCNYKFNFLQYTSLFKSVLKIYICKLNFCGSLFKKKRYAAF